VDHSNFCQPVPRDLSFQLCFLAKAQKEHHEKKEKAKLSRTQVDFVAGSTTKRSTPAPAAAATTGEYQI